MLTPQITVAGISLHSVTFPNLIQEDRTEIEQNFRIIFQYKLINDRDENQLKYMYACSTNSSTN